MISPEQVFLAVDPVDMRWGIDRLSAWIQSIRGQSPCDGTAYAFSNRARTRLKVVVWDGTGVWLCQRRLHSGHFRWPTAEDPVFRLSAEHWQWLVSGVEWQRLAAKPHAQWMV